MNIVKTQGKIDKLFREIPLEHRSSDEYINIIDSANVCSVEAKTVEGSDLLRLFSDKESSYKPVKLQDLQYAKYSLEYLKRIIDIFASTDSETVTIGLREDYPITIENKDLKFILAPRVDN